MWYWLCHVVDIHKVVADFRQEDAFEKQIAEKWQIVTYPARSI